MVALHQSSWPTWWNTLKNMQNLTELIPSSPAWWTRKSFWRGIPWICQFTRAQVEVCFGVPYGMHLWQVVDSKEQNRSFKCSSKIFKAALVQQRANHWMECKIEKTNVIQIVWTAWNDSFSSIVKNKQVADIIKTLGIEKTSKLYNKRLTITAV